MYREDEPRHEYVAARPLIFGKTDTQIRCPAKRQKAELYGKLYDGLICPENPMRERGFPSFTAVNEQR
jgi:hypothetical protein